MRVPGAAHERACAPEDRAAASRSEVPPATVAPTLRPSAPSARPDPDPATLAPAATLAPVAAVRHARAASVHDVPPPSLAHADVAPPPHRLAPVRRDLRAAPAGPADAAAPPPLRRPSSNPRAARRLARPGIPVNPGPGHRRRRRRQPATDRPTAPTSSPPPRRRRGHICRPMLSAPAAAGRVAARHRQLPALRSALRATRATSAAHAGAPASRPQTCRPRFGRSPTRRRPSAAWTNPRTSPSRTSRSRASMRASFPPRPASRSKTWAAPTARTSTTSRSPTARRCRTTTC